MSSTPGAFEGYPSVTGSRPPAYPRASPRPLLDVVGEPLGNADDAAVVLGDAAAEVADGEPVAAGLLVPRRGPLLMARQWVYAAFSSARPAAPWAADRVAPSAGRRGRRRSAELARTEAWERETVRRNGSSKWRMPNSGRPGPCSWSGARSGRAGAGVASPVMRGLGRCGSEVIVPGPA